MPNGTSSFRVSVRHLESTRAQSRERGRKKESERERESWRANEKTRREKRTKANEGVYYMAKIAPFLLLLSDIKFE